MPAYLDRLSRFVCKTNLEGLEPATVTAAKSVVLDTIGAMLAGSLLPENEKLAQLAAKNGGQAHQFFWDIPAQRLLCSPPCRTPPPEWL